MSPSLKDGKFGGKGQVKSPCAFTLIELVGVLVIVGVLAALFLAPVAGRIQEAKTMTGKGGR